MKFEIRHYESTDRNALFQFLTETFGSESAQCDERRFAWEFEQNPHKPDSDILTWICTAEDKIIGQVAMMPVSLNIDKETFQAAWLVDLMVLPEFRNRGIGPLLIRQLQKDISSPLLVLVGDAYTIYSKLGWLYLFEIPLFVKVLSTRRCLNQFLGNSFLAALATPICAVYLRLFRRTQRAQTTGTRIRKVDSFGDEIDEFWNWVSKFYPIIIKRDQKYLNWKFVHQPSTDYHLLEAQKDRQATGYAVLGFGKLQKRLKIGVIIDMLFAPDDGETQQLLVTESIAHFRDNRVDMIVCSTSNRKFRETLKSNGFLNYKSNMRVMLSPASFQTDRELLTKPDNWFITGGDADGDIAYH